MEECKMVTAHVHMTQTLDVNIKGNCIEEINDFVADKTLNDILEICIMKDIPHEFHYDDKVVDVINEECVLNIKEVNDNE